MQFHANYFVTLELTGGKEGGNIKPNVHGEIKVIYSHSELRLLLNTITCRINYKGKTGPWVWFNQINKHNQ